MTILWIILIGFVAGVVARLLMRGPNRPSGFLLTTALGIGGAFVATFIGQAVGWYRADPRGNRVGIDAQFVPPVERLAFDASLPGEVDSPDIWVDPLPAVVEALRAHDRAAILAQHLPDVALDRLTAVGRVSAKGAQTDGR